MSNYIHYVYKITLSDLDNRQIGIYVGKHSTSNLFDSYICSSDYIKSMINSGLIYKRTILEIFGTDKEASMYEQMMIKRHCNIKQIYKHIT